jgi:SCY1-like protein 1
MQTRKRVLIPAFSIATRDPFPHARIAGLLAYTGNLIFSFFLFRFCFVLLFNLYTATQDYYSREDCALKVVPCISPLLIDPEKCVVIDNGKKIIINLLINI